MYSLFENLLAARDDNPWVQLIIVAVIIGFSVLKAIARKIKAMAEQKSQQNEEKPQKPLSLTGGRGKYVYARDAHKTLEQLRAEKITQIRAAFGIPEPPAEPPPVVVETPQVVEKNEEPVAVIQHPKIKKPAARFVPPPQEAYVEPVSSKVSAEEHKAHIPSSPPAGKTVYERLFSSRQDLRNAILYQEILGKPLALRDTL